MTIHQFTGPSLLVLALLLSGCKSGGISAPPPFVPVVAAPSGWTIAYSPSMPPISGNSFDIPTAVGGEGHSDGVHYLIKRSGPISVGQTITLVFDLIGDGKIVATQGELPAAVRLFMQRAGDDMSGVGIHEFSRWWSKASVELTSPSTISLSVKIAPEEWTSVFGQSGEMVPNAFTDCVADLTAIGFTFGGEFAGHGVICSEGAVRVAIRDFSVS